LKTKIAITSNHVQPFQVLITNIMNMKQLVSWQKRLLEAIKTCYEWYVIYM